MEGSTPCITVTVKQEPVEQHNQQDGEREWSVDTSQDLGMVIKSETTSTKHGNYIGSRDLQDASVAVHHQPTLNPMSVITNPLGCNPPGGSGTLSQAAVHDMELPHDLSTEGGYDRPHMIRTDVRRIRIPLPGANQTTFNESRFAIQYHEDLSSKEGKCKSALERRYFQGRQICNTDCKTADGIGSIPYRDTGSYLSKEMQRNPRANSDGESQGEDWTMVHESGITIHCEEDIQNQQNLNKTNACELGATSQNPEISCTTTKTSHSEEVLAPQDDPTSQCKICHKNFLHLKSHMKVHTAQRPFKCSICDKAFIENRHLENHMRSHTGERPFTCPVCQKSFSRDTHLTYHFRTHSGLKPFTCETCGKSFKRKGDLTVHNSRTHTGERSHAYNSDDKADKGVMAMVHDSGIAIRCQEDILTRDGKEISISEELSCQRPEIPLVTPETSCDEEVKPVQDDPTSQCKICFKNFLHLKSHMKVHTAERPFKCSVCDKAYIESRHLDNHMRSHTGEKPFQCPVCQKAFSRDTHLTYHLRTHTGIKPFSCETCGKSFSRKGDLTVHYRIHTGERPFACKLCDKACSTQSNLKLHMRGHTGEKPYSCTACPKTFKSKSDLIKHVRTHTGERPYQCVECHRDFRASSDLTRHMRSHTNEKPYKCNVCLKEFSTDGYLPKHACVPKTSNSGISLCPSPGNNGEAVPLQTSLGCDNKMEAVK